MDKRQILKQLLEGNTEPLIQAKEEARKDIKTLVADIGKNDTYVHIGITYTNGEGEQIERLPKQKFEALQSRVKDNDCG
jgi:protein involved in ribonucleotide reduction